MGRIQERFELLRGRDECALVTFLTAGDPDLETTEALIPCLAAAGADLIEIGVPFSDPIAEGVSIQRASERALASGTSLRRILAMVARLRPRIDVPLLLMGYANPIHAMGPEGFAKAAAAAGVDGIIVPDLPPEEGEPFYRACHEQGIDGVLLAAPTTSPARLAKLVAGTRGFLYYVSLQGVTGAREQLASDIEANVKKAQKLGHVPVCVGFGISTPEQAARIARYADGVVVGSAIVDAIHQAGGRAEAIDAVTRLVGALKAPLRRG